MNEPASRASALSRPAPFQLLICGTLVLYVYRLFIVGANLSLFRLLLAGWTLVALVDLLRGRLPIGPWQWALGGIVGAVVAVNAVEFAGLGGHPDLRRDVLNHLLNVWFTVLLALYVRSHAAAISLLAAFVWSSLLTSAITLASWALGALPFEGWLRAYGGPAARHLPYLGYDLYFNRATSAFYDPNFYGIYSALVVLTALGLWLTVERRRWLLALAALNVVFLSASLSRTGLMGLLGGLAAGVVVYRGDRRPARRLIVLTAAATCVCFLAGSAIQSRANRERVASWWAGRPSSPTAGATRPAGAPADVTAPRDQDRLIGSASVSDRFRRIQHGWHVFRSGPWLGRGGAALLRPDFPPHASAHLVYLTLLARYGIVGTLIYAAFALVPLVTIARRRGPPADRIVVTAAACWALVFVSYDVFLSFEIVYLFLGLAWALATLAPGDAGHAPGVDAG